MDANSVKNVEELLTKHEIPVRLQNARDVSANWSAANPILLNGEIVIVNDTVTNKLRIKLGDGFTRFNDLEYYDNLNDKGKPNGLASLDAKGKIPLSQLPEGYSSGSGGSTGTVTPPVDDGKTISILPSQKNTLTYNGSEQTPEWNNFDSTKMILASGDKGTDAGSYQAVFMPIGGYHWENNSFDAKLVQWSIQKDTGTLSSDKDSLVFVGAGIDKKQSITITTNIDGNLTISGNDESIASSNIDTTNNRLIYVVPKSYGLTSLSVSTYDISKNYTIPSLLNIPINVKRAGELAPEDVNRIVKAGTAQSSFSVGDSIDILLNGTCINYTANSVTYTAQILGFNHNVAVESAGKNTVSFILGRSGSDEICLVDSKCSSYPDPSVGFIMNPKGDSRFQSDNNAYQCGFNKGGWKDSYMRNTALPALLNIIESGWSSIMGTVTKYTDNVAGTTNNNNSGDVTATTDKLFLLSEFEVFGTRLWANQFEQNKQKQYSYYANSNTKIRKRSDTLANYVWWLRSPYYSDTYIFCGVSGSGGANSYNAAGSCGVSPAWILGES